MRLGMTHEYGFFTNRSRDKNMTQIEPVRSRLIYLPSCDRRVVNKALLKVMKTMTVEDLNAIMIIRRKY
jgi:hypothetical protein